MSTESKIEWTTHTFNPWWGCQKVHSGCAHCYAETMDHRWGGDHWGPDAQRRMVLGEWAKPASWNRTAIAEGRRARVFCASMADLFEDYPGDRPVVDNSGRTIDIPLAFLRRFPYDALCPRGLWTVPALRRRTLELVSETPALDWLLLTKRPENVLRMILGEWGERIPENVWIGTSPCDQKTADESIPAALRVGALTGARIFLSVEPLLGPIELASSVVKRRVGDPQPSWIIVGGESGPKARPFVIEDAIDIVRDCRAALVPVFVKQLGSNPRRRDGTRLELKSSKGRDIEEWPEELRVRQFPAFSGPKGSPV